MTKEIEKYLKRLVEIEEYKYNELIDNHRDNEVDDIYLEVSSINMMLVEIYKLIDCKFKQLEELMQDER